jgi:hypothetical protein
LPPVIKLSANTTTATVTNTTTETALTSITLPSYLLDEGRAVRSWAMGSLTAASTGSVTVSSYIKSSTSTGFGTQLASAVLSPTTSANPRWWGFESSIVAATTAAQRHQTRIKYTAASTALMPPSTVDLSRYSTSGISHAKAMVLTVTAQWSAASTGRSIDLRTGWTEAVR